MDDMRDRRDSRDDDRQHNRGTVTYGSGARFGQANPRHAQRDWENDRGWSDIADREDVQRRPDSGWRARELTTPLNSPTHQRIIKREPSSSPAAPQPERPTLDPRRRNSSFSVQRPPNPYSPVAPTHAQPARQPERADRSAEIARLEGLAKRVPGLERELEAVRAELGAVKVELDREKEKARVAEEAKTKMEGEARELHQRLEKKERVMDEGEVGRELQRMERAYMAEKAIAGDLAVSRLQTRTVPRLRTDDCERVQEELFKLRDEASMPDACARLSRR